MADLITLFSSSSGNSTLISYNNAKILVDAGVSASRIVSSLERINVSPFDIDAVFVTHEHSDHISGIKALYKKYSVPIYASDSAAKAIMKLSPDIKNEDMHIIKSDSRYLIKSVKVTSFSTPHDAPSSLGYTFEDEGLKLGVCTDTGEITDIMLENLFGCDKVLIEANHDVKMLISGPYPDFLKSRILSSKGHLSNENCAHLATKLALRGTKNIIIGHLSDKNNSPKIAYDTVKKSLVSNGFDISDKVVLKVAFKNEICVI